MDPLSALSIAAAVVQFVDFVPRVLFSANHIYRSAKGLTDDNANVEEVYQALTDLGTQLADCGDPVDGSAVPASGIPKDVQAMQKLALKCKADCDSLLEVVRNVAVTSGKHRVWRSLKSAVRSSMDKKKIASLELDIERTRSIISTHILSILKEQNNRLNRAQIELKAQSRSLGAEQTSKLNVVTQELFYIRQMISELRGQFAEAEKKKSAAQQKLDDLVDQKLNDLKDLVIQNNTPNDNTAPKAFSNPEMDDITEQIKTETSTEWNHVKPKETNQTKSAIPKQYMSVAQIDNIKSSLARTLEVEDQVRKEILILSSLCFSSQPARRAAIPEAHRQTFAWIYESQFAEWLAMKKAGVFWITGKAGSGKSTLMKFLSDNPQTLKIARESAAPKRAVIASHYFWSPGTEMQKSQQGLLQTLLFEIFRQCPFIIPLILPQRWDEQIEGNKQLPWTVPELSDALRKIGALEEYPVQFNLFIDGLDEFSGDHYELCQALRDLSQCPSIRLCVSSRPWNVFEEYFGRDPMTRIAIHHKTRDDIRKFAKSRLENHPRWKEWTLESARKDGLLDDIVERAEGVFLWAFLVTNSLMEGITNDDTVEELQKRLEDLPTDLERLFKHMLDGVEPLYHAHMAGMFRIALQPIGPLRWEIYHFYEHEGADRSYAIGLPVKAFSREEREKCLQRIKKRLNARTRGLLELNNSSDGSNQRVEFLHRTVRDFLSTGEMSDYLRSKSKSDFEASLSISKAYVALIKCTEFYKGWGDIVDQSLEDLARECLRHAIQVSTRYLGDIDDAVNELESAIVEMSTKPGSVLAFEQHEDPRGFFREVAKQERADGYLGRNLSRDWQFLAPPDAMEQYLERRPGSANSTQSQASWFSGIVEGVASTIKSYGGHG